MCVVLCRVCVCECAYVRMCGSKVYMHIYLCVWDKFNGFLKKTNLSVESIPHP